MLERMPRALAFDPFKSSTELMASLTGRHAPEVAILFPSVDGDLVRVLPANYLHPSVHALHQRQAEEWYRTPPPPNHILAALRDGFRPDPSTKEGADNSAFEYLRLKLQSLVHKGAFKPGTDLTASRKQSTSASIGCLIGCIPTEVIVLAHHPAGCLHLRQAEMTAGSHPVYEQDTDVYGNDTDRGHSSAPLGLDTRPISDDDDPPYRKPARPSKRRRQPASELPVYDESESEEEEDDASLPETSDSESDDVPRSQEEDGEVYHCKWWSIPLLIRSASFAHRDSE